MTLTEMAEKLKKEADKIIEEEMNGYYDLFYQQRQLTNADLIEMYKNDKRRKDNENQ